MLLLNRTTRNLTNINAGKRQTRVVWQWQTTNQGALKTRVVCNFGTKHAVRRVTGWWPCFRPTEQLSPQSDPPAQQTPCFVSKLQTDHPVFRPSYFVFCQRQTTLVCRLPYLLLLKNFQTVVANLVRTFNVLLDLWNSIGNCGHVVNAILC